MKAEEVGVNEKKGKKKKLILLLLLLLLVVGVGIGLFVFLQPKEDDFFFDSEAKNGLIEARTKEDVQEILNQVVEKGMFNASINPNPVFENGTAEGDLWIENIKANHYYTTVTITLDDTGETVFQSKGIKPDQYIERATLSKNLPKGEYPASAMFSIIDPESMKEIGRVNLKINITVKN